MSNAIKSTLGVSGAALFIIVATNAEPLFKGLTAGWIFVSGIATQAPLGISSFIFASILAASVIWFMVKWMPNSITTKGRYGRSFLIDVIALLVGIFGVYFQMKGMLGLLVGTVAGLLAPLLYKIVAGSTAWFTEITKGEDV